MVTMFSQSPIGQFQTIVPAGRLMKVSASFKHKVTTVSMHSKAVTIQKTPCGAKEGKKGHLFGGARFSDQV